MSDQDDARIGRPPKYDPEAHPRVAEAMCKLGATDLEIADALGIVRSTFYKWKHDFPIFSDALKLGKAPADDRVEASLYRKAVGYEIDQVKIFQFQGQEVIVPYREYIHPDTTAAIFWLKNRRPEQWRANPEGNADDNVAQPTQVVIEVKDARKDG